MRQVGHIMRRVGDNIELSETPKKAPKRERRRMTKGQKERKRRRRSGVKNKEGEGEGETLDRVREGLR